MLAKTRDGAFRNQKTTSCFVIITAMTDYWPVYSMDASLGEFK